MWLFLFPHEVINSAKTGTMTLMNIAIFPGTSTELDGVSSQCKNEWMNEWMNGFIYKHFRYQELPRDIIHPVSSTIHTEQLLCTLGIVLVLMDRTGKTKSVPHCLWAQTLSRYTQGDSTRQHGMSVMKETKPGDSLELWKRKRSHLSWMIWEAFLEVVRCERVFESRQSFHWTRDKKENHSRGE